MIFFRDLPFPRRACAPRGKGVLRVIRFDKKGSPMHTYFINTSSSVVFGDYKEVLFENLLADKDLIIPADHCDLSVLGAGAEEIADQIDRETDIGEDIRLAVYLESGYEASRALSPLEAMVAIRAEEILQALKAEAELVWTLCEHGKKPRELIIILGEKVDRDDIPTDGDHFQAELRRRCWSLIALPAVKDVLDYLKQKPDVGKEELVRMMRERAVMHDGILLSADDHCYESVLTNVSNLILDNLKLIGSSLERDPEAAETLMYRCLYDGIGEFRNHFLQDALIENRADKVCYLWQKVSDKDPHERSRSTCQLMLFVYCLSCMDKDGSPKAGLLPGDAAFPFDPHVETTLENACLLPEVNYPELTYLLIRMRRHFDDAPVFTPLEVPDAMAEELRDHRKERNGKKDDGEEKPLIETAYPVPVFDMEIKAKRKYTVKSIEKEIKDQLSEFRTRWKEYYDSVQRYVNRVSDEYDRIKDDRLASIPYVEDGEAFAPPADMREEVMIRRLEDLKNKKADAERSVLEARKKILSGDDTFTTLDSMEESIRSVEEHIEDCINRLKFSVALFTSGVGFVLGFLVPYIVLKAGVLSFPQDSVYLAALAGAAAAAYVIGYRFFVVRGKNRIHELFRKLCEKLNAAQEANRNCLTGFDRLLHTDIPRCYGRYRYSVLLYSFYDRLDLRKRMITYHTASIGHRMDTIKSLLDQLDSHWEDAEQDGLPSLDMSTALDPEKDRVENKGYYMIPACKLLKVLD